MKKNYLNTRSKKFDIGTVLTETRNQHHNDGIISIGMAEKQKHVQNVSCKEGNEKMDFPRKTVKYPNFEK